MAEPHPVDPGAKRVGAERGAWRSRLGFVLAASGSAVGLGNIVFFASSAYEHGGGAFYLPYLLALFVLGIPVMIAEFALGTMTGQSFPLALRRLVGKKGEFVGWWSLSSALFITMYYVTILGWALAMLVGALGGLLTEPASAPFAGMTEPTEGPDALVYFFGLIASGWPVAAVAAVWLMALVALWRGTKTIEAMVRVFVPLLWLFMVVLIVRGLTLPGGVDGVLYFFTPNLDGIRDVDVWQGAFAQMFFSLSLGLGTMTAYASYLPKDADPVNSALVVSFLNCAFEYLAAIAVFSLLFVFALNPSGGTLSLAFFAIPQGIAAFPFWVKGFGALFFFLLVVAGLTGVVAIVEGMASALIDKLGVSRAKALALVTAPGFAGSLLCALPLVLEPGVDPRTGGDGTLGFTLLDLIDHWAFGYSLLTVGLLECLLLGWVLGAGRLRAAVNAHTRLRLGWWFDGLIKLVIPAVLGYVLLGTLTGDLRPLFDREPGGLYGSGHPLGGFDWLPAAVPAFWLVGTLVLALVLTSRPAAGAGRPVPAPTPAA